MPFQVFDERILVNYVQPIVNADGTNPVAIVTADPPGLRIDGISCSNDDAIPHVLEIGVNAGATSTWLGSVSVPAGAGQGGLPATDILATLSLGLVGAILLASGIQLVARVAVVVGAGQFVILYVVGGGF